jgi:hypothetical protein
MNAAMVAGSGVSSALGGPQSPKTTTGDAHDITESSRLAQRTPGVVPPFVFSPFSQARPASPRVSGGECLATTVASALLTNIAAAGVGGLSPAKRGARNKRRRAADF